MIDIATGEKPDRDLTPEEQGAKGPGVALGKMGGTARGEGLSSKKRREIAKKASKVRWS